MNLILDITTNIDFKEKKDSFERELQRNQNRKNKIGIWLKVSANINTEYICR
jgi:hypothetical protein